MNSESLFKLFFEEASDAVIAVQLPSKRIEVVNRAFCELSGLNRDELQGEALAAIQTSLPQGFERERQLDARILQEPGIYNDIALVTRDGNLRFVSVKVRHIEVEKQMLAIAVLTDDTERQLMLRDLVTKHQSLEMAYVELEKVHTELKVTQERMSQAAKLVALGELAAGMSHELNQPLTGIRGFAQEVQDILTHQKKPSRKEVLGLCSEIVSNSDKMASLLSHLRNFARQERNHFDSSGEKPEVVKVIDVWQNVDKLLSKQLQKQNIKVEVKDLDANVVVWAKAHPIEQILINLLTNSRDAILSKRLGDEDFRGHILLSVRDAGKNWKISVRDNGNGISEAIKKRIFDPFFSTKESGAGMGLGLSISFSIAHNFGGELFLESSSPSGTTFVLSMPKEPVANRRAA